MSKTIRVYKPLVGDELSVTAYIGPGWQAAVQITLQGDQGFSGLSEAQVRDLIKILQKRLRKTKGYMATDWGEGDTILPDGSVEEDETLSKSKQKSEQEENQP